MISKELKKIVDGNKEEIRAYLNEYDNWPDWMKQEAEWWLEDLKKSQDWQEKYNETLGEQ